MELVKVNDIIHYEGRLYLIRPYIEEGKIKRKTIYTGIKRKVCEPLYGNSIYCLGNFAGLRWYQTKFHFNKTGENVTDDTIAAGYSLRIFTDRDSAKKALEEYETQNAYKLTESINEEIKYLEAKKKKLNDKIKALKEKRKECFEKLTTNFTKNS